jgi:hypothetical protein
MIEGGLGHNGKDFVASMSKLYTKNKAKFPFTKRPTTIKAAIALAKKMGKDVYSKEDGWQWSRI